MIPVSTNYPFSDPQDERSGLRGCTDSLEQIQTMHRIQRENRSFLDPFRYNLYPAKRKVPIMTSRLNEPVIMLILPMAPGKLSNISVRQRRVCTVTQRQRRRLALGFLPYWRARRHSRRRSLDRGARPDFQSRLGFIARSRSFVRSDCLSGLDLDESDFSGVALQSPIARPPARTRCRRARRR